MVFGTSKVIVMKFGGTSVGSGERIATIARLVKDRIEQRPIVVVSAVAGTTDLLLRAFNATNRTDRVDALQAVSDKHIDIIAELWPIKADRQHALDYLSRQTRLLQRDLSHKSRPRYLQDRVLAHGEMTASYIVAHYMSTQDISSQQIVASSMIVTNGVAGAAEPVELPTKKRVAATLLPLVEEGIVPVVTGFIGANRYGRITTLGRGGSDYTAAIVGYCLQAQEIQIWTDVDGMFTTDPRLVKDAQLIDHLSFKEASELAAFGAKILHPKTIRPAIRAGIPVRILNTFRPELSGTYITKESESTRPVLAIACKKKVVVVNLYATEMLFHEGYLARISTIFAKYHISVDLLSASEASVSVTLDNDEDLQQAVKELETFTAVSIQRDAGVVSLVGHRITESPSTIRTVFSVLESLDVPVRMVSLGASDINISLVVPEKQVAEAVTAFHDQFITQQKKEITR